MTAHTDRAWYVYAVIAPGQPARRVGVYAARETRPTVAELERALAAQVVLAHSPRAGRILAGLLAPRASRPSVLGLSPACLTPLEGLDLPARAAPDRPLETDLINLLASLR